MMYVSLYWGKFGAADLERGNNEVRFHPPVALGGRALLERFKRILQLHGRFIEFLFGRLDVLQ